MPVSNLDQYLNVKKPFDHKGYHKEVTKTDSIFSGNAMELNS